MTFGGSWVYRMLLGLGVGVETTCHSVSGMHGLFCTAVTAFMREYWWIFIVIVGPCICQEEAAH